VLPNITVLVLHRRTYYLLIFCYWLETDDKIFVVIGDGLFVAFEVRASNK